jgi:hypothetical protein
MHCLQRGWLCALKVLPLLAFAARDLQFMPAPGHSHRKSAIHLQSVFWFTTAFCNLRCHA